MHEKSTPPGPEPPHFSHGCVAPVRENMFTIYNITVKLWLKINDSAKIRIIHDDTGTPIVQNDYSSLVSGEFYMILEENQEWKPFTQNLFMKLLDDVFRGKYSTDSTVCPLDNLTERQMVLLLNGFSTYTFIDVVLNIRCR